jgi:hypothetical protein
MEMARKSTDKSLMRNLGEFFGHVWKGVKTDPSKQVIRTDVEEDDRGDMVLRRTIIDEVEFRPKKPNHDRSNQNECTDS